MFMFGLIIFYLLYGIVTYRNMCTNSLVTWIKPGLQLHKKLYVGILLLLNGDKTFNTLFLLTFIRYQLS